MSLAEDFWNAWSDFLVTLPTSVHVAHYTGKDIVTYVLSDDQTFIRLTVQHAEKKETSESRVNIIAPNLVRMLTEGTELAKEERNTEGSTREGEG